MAGRHGRDQLRCGHTGAPLDQLRCSNVGLCAETSAGVWTQRAQLQCSHMDMDMQVGMDMAERHGRHQLRCGHLS
eukprot:5207816-Karenia_brevis.AAC.1